MANPIVVVNVSQEQAPAPSTLQKTGALISQGGTITSAQALTLLQQPSDLTPLLPSPLAITGLSWAGSYGGQVTVTTAAPHGVTINEEFVTTISGAIPAGYNGTFLATATGSSTFTYYLSANPGSETTPGTYTQKGVGELQAMVTTFFAQLGPAQSVYVLELGAGEPNAGVTALTQFITNNSNPQIVYSYLVPRAWDGNTNFIAFLANFNSTTSKTYFWITTNAQNYGLYPTQDKCVELMIEAPSWGAWATNAFTAATWSGNEVTATTTTSHGVKPGDTFTVVGNTPAGYNGTFIALPGTTGSTLVYGVATNPGSNTILGSLVASVYPSTGIPATEFSMASEFARSLAYNPGPGNPVTSFAYSYLYGVTAFPQRGTSSLTTALEAGQVSYVASGSEGGISNTFLKYGHTRDTHQFNYWFSVDWVQINAQLRLAAAIINGSNNPDNPLFLNQRGIDRLQQVVAGLANSAITFGLAVGSVNQVELDPNVFAANLTGGDYDGQVVINAIPFTIYYADQPSDYRIGQYNGLTMAYTPQGGFEHIIFNVVVTDFVAA